MKKMSWKITLGAGVDRAEVERILEAYTPQMKRAFAVQAQGGFEQRGVITTPEYVLSVVASGRPGEPPDGPIHVWAVRNDSHAAASIRENFKDWHGTLRFTPSGELTLTPGPPRS